MAYFARIDGGNKVLSVIVADQESIDNGYFGDPTMWLLGEVHDGGYRYNSPCVGFTYSPEDDAFIPPQPFKGWILNTTNFTWEPPTPKPKEPWFDSEGRYNNYLWDEDLVDWRLDIQENPLPPYSED